MIEFTNDKILLALPVIILLLFFFLIHRILRKKALSKYASITKHPVLLPDVSPSKPWIKHILILFAFILLIIGLSGPRVGSKLTEVDKKGREIIIALDVSYSMLAADVRPNRLEMAKTAISRLFERLEDDKVGLIVFAGDAYTQIPLTNDYSSAKVFLASAGPTSVSKHGTSIAAAIQHAVRSFKPVLADEAGVNSRALIIITDGEDHEEGVFEAAEAAYRQGIVIHTIGIGDPDGVPVPLHPGSSNFRRDGDGKVVVSRLDEQTLTTIADITGGFYIRAGRDALGLYRLIARLDELERQDFTVMKFEEYEERFQYFIGFALLLFLLDFFLTDTRNRWISSLKIFDTNE